MRKRLPPKRSKLKPPPVEYKRPKRVVATPVVAAPVRSARVYVAEA